MVDGEALRIAIDLLHVPSRVRLVRAEPLPRGVPLLLRVAAGDGEIVDEAARMADRTRDVVRQAAVFFIEQILLCAEADSYRVLGVRPDASSGELRQNMALLIKWLHPDMDRPDQQTILVNRVTMAWDNLKTPERRAAYDQARQALPVKKSGRGRSRSRRRSGPSASRRHLGPPPGSGLFRRALHFLFGARR
jgi:hypothetical protein